MGARVVLALAAQVQPDMTVVPQGAHNFENNCCCSLARERKLSKAFSYIANMRRPPTLLLKNIVEVETGPTKTTVWDHISFQSSKLI